MSDLINRIRQAQVRAAEEVVVGHLQASGLVGGTTDQPDESEALRDMLGDARTELEMLREALGVPIEPHQNLFERMLDAARAHGAAQSAASVGPCKLEAIHVGNLPTLNQDEYPGLGDWWAQLRIGPDSDEVLARVYGNTPEQARSRAVALAAPVAAQPTTEDAIYLGCARMGLAEASDEEVLNYVRIAKQRSAAPTPPASGQAQQDEKTYKGDIVGWLRRRSGPIGCTIPGKLAGEIADHIEALQTQQNVAANDVLAERRRQIEAEGWTPDHDDGHSNGEMADAAACYAAPSIFTLIGLRLWPWDHQWWKPTTRRRDLVKAGALILAEIERLDRATRRNQDPPVTPEEEESWRAMEGKK